MTTKEALQAMLDGKRVIPKEWVGAYVFFNGTHFVREDGKQFLFGSLEYEWEIYEEPKPKQVIVLETWLIEDCINEFTVFRTVEVQKGLIDHMVEAYDYERKVKLLSTREVEL